MITGLVKNEIISIRQPVSRQTKQLWIDETERIRDYIKRCQPSRQPAKQDNPDPHILEDYVSGGFDVKG